MLWVDLDYTMACIKLDGFFSQQSMMLPRLHSHSLKFTFIKKRDSWSTFKQLAVNYSVCLIVEPICTAYSIYNMPVCCFRSSNWHQENPECEECMWWKGSGGSAEVWAVFTSFQFHREQCERETLHKLKDHPHHKNKSISIQVWVKSLTGCHVNTTWVLVKRSSKHEKVKSYITVLLSHQCSTQSNMSTRLWSCTCLCAIQQHLKICLVCNSVSQHACAFCMLDLCRGNSCRVHDITAVPHEAEIAF